MNTASLSWHCHEEQTGQQNHMECDGAVDVDMAPVYWGSAIFLFFFIFFKVIFYFRRA